MQSAIKKFFLIVMILGILLSINLSYQVKAKDSTPPTITTIQNSAEYPSSSFTQASEPVKIQEVELNTQAIDQIAMNLSTNRAFSQSARLQIFNDLSLDVIFDQVENTKRKCDLSNPKLIDPYSVFGLL